jgi:hypothetical protein
MKLFAAALLAATLAACAAGNAPPTAGGRRVSYACDRGPGMTVIYAGDMARIESGNGQTLLLQRKKSDAGFWYESPTHRIRGQGNLMTFWPAYTRMKTCHAM